MNTILNFIIAIVWLLSYCIKKIIYLPFYIYKLLFDNKNNS